MLLQFSLSKKKKNQSKGGKTTRLFSKKNKCLDLAILFNLFSERSLKAKPHQMRFEKI